MPITGVPGVPGIGAQDNPFVNFLRQLMQQRQGLAPMPAGPGGNPFAASSAPTTLRPPTPATPTMALPGLGGGPMPQPLGMGMNDMLGGGYGALAKQAPPALPGLGGGPMIPTPSTKTEPQAPLSFSWGSGAPQPYQAGQTDILNMRGAPAARGGFMGAQPVAGGMQPGGFSPSQTDWSKVANPAAFESFTERPARNALEQAAKNPLWEEQGRSDIQQQREIAVAKGTIGAQAEAVQQANEQARRETEALANQWIQQENARRTASGKPPLSFEEEQGYYGMAQMRYGGRPTL